jgi:hypothetical protein
MLFVEGWSIHESFARNYSGSGSAGCGGIHPNFADDGNRAGLSAVDRCDGAFLWSDLLARPAVWQKGKGNGK